MKPFRHCPACAALLEAADAEGGARCPSCGRVWYRNSAPTASAVIVRDGKVLVTLRAKEPFKGKHDIPGGFLKPGEDALDGLKRELREELGVGVEVNFNDFVRATPHHYGDEDDWVLSLTFAARIVQGEPSPADDVAALKWADRAELERLDFAWPHDREVALEALNRDQRGRDDW